MSENVLSQLHSKKCLELQDAVIFNIMTWMPNNFKKRFKCKPIIKNKFDTIYLFVEVNTLWLHIMCCVSKYVCW